MHRENRNSKKVMELTNVFPYFVGLLALAFVLLVARGLTTGAWNISTSRRHSDVQ